MTLKTVEVDREDVRMGVGEDEEPLEAEIPGVRNEQEEFHESRKKKNMKIRDMLLTEVGVPLVSKEKELVGNIELNTPIVLFDKSFMTQENADALPILMCRDGRFGQTGATRCEGKGPTAYSTLFRRRFHQRFRFFAESFRSVTMNRARVHFRMQ